MDKYPLGGSIPFVALNTMELLSEGHLWGQCVGAVTRVHDIDLGSSQSYFNLMLHTSSGSFLYVSVGNIPSAYFVLSKYSHLPFSLANVCTMGEVSNIGMLL